MRLYFIQPEVNRGDIGEQVDALMPDLARSISLKFRITSMKYDADIGLYISGEPGTIETATLIREGLQERFQSTDISNVKVADWLPSRGNILTESDGKEYIDELVSIEVSHDPDNQIYDNPRMLSWVELPELNPRELNHYI